MQCVIKGIIHIIIYYQLINYVHRKLFSFFFIHTINSKTIYNTTYITYKVLIVGVGMT